jgi:site-specific recombinase XerD
LRQFQHYLRQERGLAEATINCYTPIVRAFLAECFPTEIPDFHRLCASAIADFVQRHAQRTTTKHATNAVSAVRSFLRHLLHRGAIDTDLAACVSTIATWSLSNVPKFLPAEQIQRVLSSCDLNTAIGKRNYAILLLLARLGLRAGEVVALTLDDLDWEAGLITVRAKGKRETQMPLPVEAGAAMADYLRQARPHCSCRRVFIRKNAPLVGFANSVAICSLVDRALQRAGVASAYRGSHLFRHSLATQMLKQGRPCPRLAICCDIAVRTRPQSTPRSILSHFVPSPCLGREVSDEATARRHCGLPLFASQLGIQTARHGRLPELNDKRDEKQQRTTKNRCNRCVTSCVKNTR